MGCLAVATPQRRPAPGNLPEEVIFQYHRQLHQQGRVDRTPTVDGVYVRTLATQLAGQPARRGAPLGHPVLNHLSDMYFRHSRVSFPRHVRRASGETRTKNARTLCRCPSTVRGLRNARNSRTDNNGSAHAIWMRHISHLKIRKTGLQVETLTYISRGHPSLPRSRLFPL